jgi:hypothetical protein
MVIDGRKLSGIEFKKKKLTLFDLSQLFLFVFFGSKSVQNIYNYLIMNQ